MDIMDIMEIMEIMKMNSLNKLMVLSLCFLLSMDLSMAMAMASTHPKPVNLDKFKKNIDFQRSSYIKAGLSYLELKKCKKLPIF
jgi:hypothetical protein